MTNTSATGGYLVPSSAGPAEDDALEDLIHDAIAGITGLVGTLVRPKFQPRPPDRPELSVDWCAFTVTSDDPNWGAAIIHHPEGDGSDEMRRHSTLDVLCTFYGPNANGYATKLREGLLLPQNFEALQANGIDFLEAGRVFAAPEFINNQWNRRRDLTIRFRREVSRTYPVLNLLSAEGTVVSDDGDANAWNTEN